MGAQRHPLGREHTARFARCFTDGFGWALPWLPLFLVLIVGLGVLVAVVFARKRRLLLPTAS